MIMASLEALGKLSKDELLEVALDGQNSAQIQDFALQKWMALDEHEHHESMARMRQVVRQYWDAVRSTQQFQANKKRAS